MTMTTTRPTNRPTSPAGAQKPVTAKPAAAANRGATFLKTTLVVGGIWATLLGANLAARQEQGATTPTAVTATNTSNIQAVAALPNLPATDLGTTDANAVLNMPLAPIPSLILPAVTRSQSSR